MTPVFSLVAYKPRFHYAIMPDTGHKISQEMKRLSIELWFIRPESQNQLSAHVSPIVLDAAI